MYTVITSQVISIGITANKLPPTPLEGRKYVLIQNLGSPIIYIGGSLITADTAGTGGLQLTTRSTWRETYSDNVDIYGIVATGSTQVLIEEGK